MINRGLPKTSQYIFNAKTGMLEKIEENIEDIETLSKKTMQTIDDMAKSVNKQLTSKDPINNITVITADDNLIHNYFTSMDVSWDSSNCLSTAIIKMPKMNTENTNYWVTYTGQLTVYAGYNFTFDYVNDNSHQTEKDAAESLTKYWNNSDIKPFFRGEISRVKEMDEYIIIYVDSIGRRFQQKIPDEFRQAFIYNQNVRDAFQAICEFLGVKYICPPKTATDDGETEGEEETTTDGTENDVSTQKQKANNISNTVKNKVNAATSNSSSSTPNNSSATGGTENGTNTENGENGEETTEEDALTNNEEIDTPQNGYGDINFDANGAITHGSTVIETSPDMAETLLAMEENPLEKYLEDETGIIESVQKLLDGEMFDELHNDVMDYGAVTVEPKASSTSEMSTTGSTGASGGTGASGDTNGSSNSGSTGNNSSGNSSSSNSAPRGAGYVHRVIPQPSSEAIRSHRGTTAKEKLTSKHPFARIFIR